MPSYINKGSALKWPSNWNTDWNKGQRPHCSAADLLWEGQHTTHTHTHTHTHTLVLFLYQYTHIHMKLIWVIVVSSAQPVKTFAWRPLWRGATVSWSLMIRLWALFLLFCFSLLTLCEGSSGVHWSASLKGGTLDSFDTFSRPNESCCLSYPERRNKNVKLLCQRPQD